MTRTVVLLMSCVLLASSASAQEIAGSFAELRTRIRFGETLFITDNRGATIEGRLLTVAGSSMDVRLGRNEGTPPLRLSESDVNNIYVVRRDPLWNGPLIGFAIGAGLAAVVEGINTKGTQKFQGGSVIGLGSLCALVGLTFDLFNKEKITVYVQTPRSKI